ncbi:aldose 1-epimerase family protein [Proteus hauseri ATCC 700826]|uniref:Putative glucose-6-phosphate 1-epimerase n=1 Tax=Proteus hauseri ATCC 700826 TaxID=1354271 RepID=A0AAJ3LTL2_PROHU|nr:D-hexose-6-phosphate mutarotase [Proteus hauseri]OAT46722.1 aldose 1-epimerase family protein [Proteus hauseri ATCC 700826]
MNEKIFSLPIIEQISPYLSRRQLDELPILVISHPKVRAAISLQGAHLIAWQPAQEHPVFWLSEDSLFTPGVAIRGGIPICWPWFASAGTPSHGFARILPWEFSAHSEQDDGVLITMSLKESQQTKKYWPHEFTVIARFKLGATCEVELESYGDYEATAALHSYFNVSDIDNVSVTGLGGHYIDTVADKEVYTDETSLRFNGRTDRLYTEPEDFNLIHDDGWDRTIEVHHYHHSDVVCWNPGAELASSMKDMNAGGYRKMACVETARIHQPLKPDNVHPGRLSVVVRVRKNIAEK